MKQFLVIPLLLIATSALAQTQIEPFAQSITRENLKNHIYTLASDTLQGRETGKPGQKKAAKYIAAHFRNYGLDSLHFQGYFQPFNLYKYDYGAVNIMAENTGKFADKLPYITFFGTRLFTQEMDFRDTLHFKYMGYGNDYNKSDLSDSVVVLLLDENLGETYKRVKQIASGTKAKYFLIFFPKTGLFRYDPERFPLAEIDGSDRLKAMTYKLKEPFLGKHLAKYSSYVDSIQNFVQTKDTIVMAFANPWETKRLLGLKFKDLKKLERKVAKGKASRNIELKNDTAICYINNKNYKLDTLKTENVLAYIEGSNKKDEVIVVSAHYDHLGKRGKNIYYGADDNASGTAAIMEMARAFQEAAYQGIKPSRSIVFVALSAEEVGLRGSDYFVSNSPVPLKNIVLNLNLDMVGRNRNNEDKYSQTAYIIANGKRDGMFKRTARKIARKNDSLKLSSHPGLSERMTWSFSSDHFRFKRKNIPIACFFTGLHPDYHSKRDTPDKINYAKLTEITRVGYKMLWNVANSDKNLKVKVKHPKKQNFIEKMFD